MVKAESIEDFLKRGGQINKLKPGVQKYNPKKKFPMRNVAKKTKQKEENSDERKCAIQEMATTSGPLPRGCL